MRFHSFCLFRNIISYIYLGDYMETLYLMLVTFLLSFIFIYILIRYQTIRRIGQTERDEGLITQKKKNNTPIFGGVGFVSAYFIVFTILLILNKIDFLIYMLIAVAKPPMLNLSQMTPQEVMQHFYIR